MGAGFHDVLGHHLVRTHLANLRGKLGAETRLEAVMAGLRLGLLELR